MDMLPLSGFLAGLVKHVGDIKPFLEAAEAFMDAPVEEKWPKFKPVGDIVWPIALDLLKFKASANDFGALSAQLEAQGFDGARLKRIWDAISPVLLPLLLQYLKK